MKGADDIHPIIAHAEDIERRGLMVFDDVRRMPLYDETYTTSMITIGIIKSGWMRAECDMRPVVYREHEVVVLSDNHIMCVRETSDDLSARVIVLSAAFLQRLKREHADLYKEMHGYWFRQSVHMEDGQEEMLMQLSAMLKMVSLLDGEHRTEMMMELLKVLFMRLDEIRQENGNAGSTLSPKDLLFERFYRAVEEHYRESREVRFYADMFCMGTKHFAAIVKEQTGINAITWINNYVTVQAKSMLRHMEQMSIQQVGEHLGFTELASFSRFFKNNVGMTPTEYRNSLSEEKSG